MTKHLIQHGNSLALIIDKPILDILKIDAQTQLDISTDGKTLTIAPVTDPQRKRRFHKALANTNRKFGRMLKKLAE